MLIAKLTIPLLFLMGIPILPSGCAVQVHDIASPIASSCRFSGAHAGLTISAEPFAEEDKLRKYFGEDLLSRGVLPVLVVFENQDAGDGFSILQGQAKLLIGQSTPGSGKDPHPPVKVDATEPPLTYSISPVIDVAASLAFGYVGMLSAQARNANMATIARNMEEKQLTPKIVYPGSTHQGFLYFKIGGRDAAAQIGSISFAAKNIRTNAVTTVVAVGQ